MEAAIRRGRLLREILKQDRFSPTSVAFQMAWLVAFNEGMFEQADPDEMETILLKLERAVRQTSLNLDSPREQWVTAVADWLSRTDKDAP
jgi:F-type H+-transporting ATPase subunit alpha